MYLPTVEWEQGSEQSGKGAAEQSWRQLLIWHGNEGTD